MEGDKPHKTYTRADLVRYLQGAMSPAEMHQLEKDALDDPFLAEALEGLLDFSGPDITGQLEELDARWEKERNPLEQQPQAAASQPATSANAGATPDTDIPTIPPARSVSPGKLTPLYQQGWFRAAAAILLLVGLGLAMNRLFNPSSLEDNGIAQTKGKTQVSDSGSLGDEVAGELDDSLITGISEKTASLPGPAGAAGAAESTPGESIAAAEVPVEPGKDIESMKRQQQQPGKTFADVKASNPTSDDKRKADSISLQQKAGQALAEAAPPPPPQVLEEANKSKKEQANQKDIASAQGNRETSVAPANARRLKSAQPATAEGRQGAYMFRGQVTDKDNRPLSFVNLRIPNGGLNTYTDAHGYYRIFSGDSAVVLELKAVGYQLKRAELNASTPDEKIVLQLAAAKTKTAQPRASVPEEITKLDEGMEKEEDERPDVEPADGWAAYQYYLLNNLRMPADALQSKLHGTVELSFLVSGDGKRSGYRVEKSLSPSCDREALRLLRDGPAWVIYHSEQPLRARVTVVF
jgi:hypothetical protein